MAEESWMRSAEFARNANYGAVLKAPTRRVHINPDERVEAVSSAKSAGNRSRYSPSNTRPPPVNAPSKLIVLRVDCRGSDPCDR
jgi:hypothetical protein